MHVGSNDGIEDEPVRVLDLMEDVEGVIEVEEGGGGGEGEEATRGEGVVDEAGNGHLGVDLEEVLGIAASSEVSFEDGEGDGGVEGRVSTNGGCESGGEEGGSRKVHRFDRGIAREGEASTRSRQSRESRQLDSRGGGDDSSYKVGDEMARTA